ncbi:MAG TPA: bifunctional UDP-N-acetylglucosamine diphosphorylase/glucosamine-1-phosphate N-acetyltransferase GlmU [Terriglobia bacterium]|nr:bifunctional UDP-N-acetylglucosamine diphosphorylase/glucosamine-1-phosphate N-acetyltransferase GlmU [Terriglobia bacterium]
MPEGRFSVLILAAGKATRFKSDRSKLLHRLAGRPLGEYALNAAFAAGPEQVYMVVGHQADAVREAFARPGLMFVEQREQLGTGHALVMAREELTRSPSDDLLVLVGDAPLISSGMLRSLVETHRKRRAAVTILTLQLENPRGYGRIVRGRDRRVRRIVEEKVATPAERRIKEVSSGILCFSRTKLLDGLDRLTDDNPQKEYLLTDLVAILTSGRQRAETVPVGDPCEVLGVNDRVELAAVERRLRLRKAGRLMREGVTIVNPEVTYIDDLVTVGRDTVIEPGVSLLGSTTVGSECLLRAYSTITDSSLGDRVTVRPVSVITASRIGSDTILGPFAHVRDGGVLEDGSRIGNFVEVKKSRIGRGSKAWHLTYLGDADLGDNANIGAGTVTCNYDGVNKNTTYIEEGVFIGSGSMLVAPVRIGRGAYVAAGSTITQDVPAGALGIGRAQQVVKEGWVEGRKRKAATKQKG